MSPFNAVSLDYVTAKAATAVEELQANRLDSAIRELAIATAYLADYLRAAEDRLQVRDNGQQPDQEEPER